MKYTGSQGSLERNKVGRRAGWGRAQVEGCRAGKALYGVEGSCRKTAWIPYCCWWDVEARERWAFLGVAN